MVSKVFNIATWSEINPQDNVLINGGFEVSQINGTSSVTVSTYHCDQWVVAKTGTMVANAQIVADAPAGVGLGNSLKINVSTAEASLAAGDFTYLYQPIEGTRFWKLGFGTAAAQSITVGFWTKIHRTGTYSGSLRNAAVNRSYAFTFTQNVADTWEWKTVVIPGDVTGTWVGNSSTVAAFLSFTIGAGTTFTTTAGAWGAGNFYGATGTTNGVAATTDTFQITGVVLVPGTFALPSQTSAQFVRPFQEELRLCQRYYEKTYDYGTAIGTGTLNGCEHWVSGGFASGAWQMGWSGRFKVPKRTAPTVTAYSGNSGASGKIYDANSGGDLAATVDLIGEAGFRSLSTATVAGTAIARYFHWTADARM